MTEGDIEMLMMDVEQLEDEVMVLERELQMAEMEIDNLVDEINDLERHCDRLEEENDELTDQLNAQSEDTMRELHILWATVVSKVVAGEQVTILDISKLDDIIFDLTR